MWQDLGELPPFFVILFLVPALASIPAMLRGSLLGWVAPLVLTGQLTVWFLYYYQEWPNSGMGGFWSAGVLPWLLGAAAATIAFFASRIDKTESIR